MWMALGGKGTLVIDLLLFGPSFIMRVLIALALLPNALPRMRWGVPHNWSSAKS